MQTGEKWITGKKMADVVKNQEPSIIFFICSTQYRADSETDREWLGLKKT